MQETNVGQNLEVFYDVFDESCNFLYEKLHKKYLELILLTANNILAGEVLNDLEPEDIKKLRDIYKPLEDKDFNVEEIRKAMQAQILKGIKEMNFQNGLTTPDSIGLIMAYLLSKLTKEKSLNICDPLIGSGNMLYTICNHLTINLNLFGCDHNEYMIRIAKVFADLLELNVELHLEDTLNLKIYNLDFIVFDMPNVIKDADKNYIPYKWILHYMDMLNDNGYIIGLINNDFFDYDYNKEFKKELINKGSIIGLIELPDNMFVSKPKSIIILSKKISKDKKCFMAKFTNFNDVKAFNNELLRIDDYLDSLEV